MGLYCNNLFISLFMKTMQLSFFSQDTDLVMKQTHISEIKTTIYCFITGGQKVTQYLGYVHVTLTSGYLSN